MKLRLLVPCLLVVVGLSGCLPGVTARQVAVAFLNFVLDPLSDPFACYPLGDFTAEFDVVFTGDTNAPPGRLELRQRGLGLIQLAIGTLRFAGMERFSYDLRGSGTHGDSAYAEAYVGTLDGLRMEGKYELTEEGCGTVMWNYEGRLNRSLDIPEEGGS
jgi:hypothetical protein